MRATVIGLLLLGALPSRPGYLGFGFTMHNDKTTQWLVVRGVAPGGPAARAGLAPLDVITEIDGKRIRFRDDLELLDRLARIRPGERVRLSVIHQQKKTSRIVLAGTMSDEAYERWQWNREVAGRKREEAAKQSASPNPQP